ncbi:MAG: COP23 domain-containing protein [Cyanobacteria bacterium P01_A01_bin.68]
MQRNLLVGLGIATLTFLGYFNVDIYPAFSQTNTSKAENNKVTFKCVKIFDEASDVRIPVTVAWIPEEKEHRRLIGWKSEFLPRWSPEKRCKAATKKFQEFYDKGTLNYLSTGKHEGYPIICAAQPGESCNGGNKIFTIKPGSKPEIVLQRILGIAEGETSGMLFQNSGKRLYVDVNKLLEEASPIDIKS